MEGCASERDERLLAQGQAGRLGTEAAAADVAVKGFLCLAVKQAALLPGAKAAEVDEALTRDKSSQRAGADAARRANAAHLRSRARARLEQLTAVVCVSLTEAEAAGVFVARGVVVTRRSLQTR